MPAAIRFAIKASLTPIQNPYRELPEPGCICAPFRQMCVYGILLKQGQQAVRPSTHTLHKACGLSNGELPQSSISHEARRWERGISTTLFHRLGCVCGVGTGSGGR